MRCQQKNAVRSWRTLRENSFFMQSSVMTLFIFHEPEIPTNQEGYEDEEDCIQRARFRRSNGRKKQNQSENYHP